LAQALVSEAHKTADTNVRESLAAQFKMLLAQIDQLAANPDFHRTNLPEADSLTVKLNEDNCSAVVVPAFNNSVSGDLAIDKPQNNWATNSDIRATADHLNAALIRLRSWTQSLNLSLSEVQIREHFIKTMINTLKNGAHYPTPAYTNKEGANLLALQLHQQSLNTTRSLVAQVDQNVLCLFR